MPEASSAAGLKRMAGDQQRDSEGEERASGAGRVAPSTAAACVYYRGGRRPAFGSWTNNERDSQLRERPNSGTLDVG